MHRVVTVKIGNKRFYLLKLIGAFVAFGAALMLLSNVYQMLWVASVIDVANQGETVTLNMLGISDTLKADDVNTQTGLFLIPAAGIMFWAAILVVGTVIYKTGSIIVPVEEQIRQGRLRKKKRKR
jgi:hypothetical protein